uniref:Uncharacterized protein LOC114914799 n=1 Tax=Elaeis guineensis var. tenera TaxID=51953 RepID=A0A8N4ICB8_ELAGV|nr:uncharacterized protein LOC114914799 [Elaeis guineensis]
MADADPAPSSPAVGALPSHTELDESQSELLLKLEELKELGYTLLQNLQNWRSKLDTQVKTYKDELSGYKKTLKTELEWLRSEFKDLRTTLQMQQDDVTMSLTDFRMHLNELKNQKISRWRMASGNWKLLRQPLIQSKN